MPSRKEKITCGCGMIVTRGSYKQHLQSKRHERLLLKKEHGIKSLESLFKF